MQSEMSMNHLFYLMQDIDNVEFLILDEADELLAPNFKEQINRFLEECPKSKQMMLFSATMPKDIKDVVRRYCCSVLVQGIILGGCGLDGAYNHIKA